MAKLNQSPIFRFGKDIGYQFNTDVTAGLNFTPRIIGITTSTPYTYEWQQFTWIESGDYSAQTPIQTNGGTSSASFLDLTIPLPLNTFSVGNKFVIIFKTTFASSVVVGVTQAFTVTQENPSGSSDPLLPFPNFNVVSPLTFDGGTATLAWSSTLANLNNVNNTSDLNKPVSTATQTALNGKVNKAGDTIQGTFTNSEPLTQIILTGDDTGDDSQGSPISNSSPRIELGTYQVSEYRSGEAQKGGYSELLRLRSLDPKAKPTIAWYSDDNKPKSWIVTHYQPQDLQIYANLASFPATGVNDGLRAYFADDTGLYYTWNGSAYIPLLPNNSEYYYRAIHQHISFETTDTTTTALYTRLGIPYDLDVVPITTANSHLAVTSGNNNGKPFGAFILQGGKTFSSQPIIFYPNSNNAGTVEAWKDSATDNIFANNTEGLRMRVLADGNSDNLVSGQRMMALNAEGLNWLGFNENVVIGGASQYGLGINRSAGVALDVQRRDLGVANNTEYTIARFTRTDADGFLNVGYIGNGTSIGSYQVRTTNSKDLVFGTTGATTALRIAAGTGNVTLSGTLTASNISGSNTGDQDLSGLATTSALTAGLATKQNAVITPLAKTSGGASHYGLPNTLFNSQGTSTLAINTLRYIPLKVENGVTLSNLQFEVTTAPASNANVRIGIYNTDSEMQPTTLVADFGSFAVASGFTGIVTQTISQALASGFYLITVNTDVAMTVRSLTSPTSVVLSTMGATALAQRFDVSSTFGALAGTGVKWTAPNASNGGTQHLVVFRWA
jgi:hypothetical protein